MCFLPDTTPSGGPTTKYSWRTRTPTLRAESRCCAPRDTGACTGSTGADRTGSGLCGRSTAERTGRLQSIPAATPAGSGPMTRREGSLLKSTTGYPESPRSEAKDTLDLNGNMTRRAGSSGPPTWTRKETRQISPRDMPSSGRNTNRAGQKRCITTRQGSR